MCAIFLVRDGSHVLDRILWRGLFSHSPTLYLILHIPSGIFRPMFQNLLHMGTIKYNCPDSGYAMLKKILGEFLQIEGVSLAAVAGRDGFVIETAHSGDMDIEALGALSSSVMQVFEKGGTSIDHGLPKNMVFEYGNGAIILTPVTAKEFLVIISETTGNTGSLSHSIEHSAARVTAAL